MKVKIIKKPYRQVMDMPPPKRKLPSHQLGIMRGLVRLLTGGELAKQSFVYTGSLPRDNGPYLILMNHSSFVDLKMAFAMLRHPFNIVSTHDAMLGKEWLMRLLGCTPTKKYVADVSLITDMRYALSRGRDVLMFPEAGYSFDGTATTLPSRLGRLLKVLGVSLAFIKSEGAYLYDPLYNNLKLRDVPLSASIEVVLTKEQIKSKSIEELTDIIDKLFDFDNFRWQIDHDISITSPTRAEGLHRILYKCPHCLGESMTSSGDTIYCNECGESYTLSPNGKLVREKGEAIYDHVPDWYRWQRQCVREELLSGTYHLSTPCRILIMRDYHAIYDVGEGTLTHDIDGIHLKGEDDDINCTLPAGTQYTVNADLYWYELGDVVSIGDIYTQHYALLPPSVPVAKIRLATEENYKIIKSRR